MIQEYSFLLLWTYSDVRCCRDEIGQPLWTAIERGVKEGCGTLIVELAPFESASCGAGISERNGRALSESGNLKVQVKRADAAAEKRFSAVFLC